MVNFSSENDIIEVGRRVWLKGWVASNDGNISCRVSDDGWFVLNRVSKGFLNLEDLIVVDMNGNKKYGGVLKPSSEIKMHRMSP